MHAPTLLNQSPPDDADLDTKISFVEQRLIAREQSLRLAAQTVTQRLRHKLHLGRHALPLVAGLAAASALGGLLWWKWGRGPMAARLTNLHGGASSPAGPRGGLPWVRLVPLVWPMLPTAWRSRVSPTTASTLAAVGLPLIERLLRGRELPPLTTMPFVDLSRFAGSWHVVSQLPPPRRRSEAAERLSFRLRPDGDFAVLAASATLRPPMQGGIARIDPGSGGARMRYTGRPVWLRWLPMAWSEYGILHVDESYGEALVGSHDRQRLWLLARQPWLAESRRQLLLQLAKDQGYAVEGLHETGLTEPAPAMG